MSSKSRQDEILAILENKGYVTVKYLIDRLHYSSATVNRDLNALQSRQLVTRSYGGVELVRAPYVPVFFRAHKTHTEKKNIGRSAAAYVKDGDTVFIDGSTTAQYMGQYLVNRKNLTVVTNNIVLAADLSQYGMTVICLGGMIAEAPSMLYSSETVENAARYRVDKMFFSTSAVSKDGLVASGVYDLLLKTVFSRANEIFYLVDHQKIDRPFNAVLCDLDTPDYVISDYVFSDDTKEKYPSTRFVTVEGAEENKKQ